MHWQDKIIHDLNAKYTDLEQYNTDAEQVIRAMFLSIREHIANRQQLRIEGLGRFISKPGRLWYDAHALSKKIVEKQQDGQDTTTLQTRLKDLVEFYNELAIKDKKYNLLNYNTLLTNNGFTDKLPELD
jgi:hypothetical protein